MDRTEATLLTAEQIDLIISNYMPHKLLQFIHRAGFAATLGSIGISLTPVEHPEKYEFPDWRKILHRIKGELRYARVESIAEHSYGMRELMQAIFDATSDDLYDFTDQPVILRFAGDHDLAELSLGDIMDDGRKTGINKAEHELHFMGTRIKYLPKNIREIYSSIFGFFLTKKGFIGQSLYCADKLDAIITHLLLGELGIPDSVTLKKLMLERSGQSLSQQDAEFLEKFQTDDPATIWGINFIKNSHTFSCAPIFYQIWYAVKMSLTAKWYPWWQEYAEKYDIPADLTPI